MIFFAIINIVLALIGVRRGYKTKSFIFFIWLIVFYYSITSMVSLLEHSEISMKVRYTYSLNMTLCILAFLLSDLVFNRSIKKDTISFKSLEGSKILLRIVELVFWISIGLTFIELRTQDYATYNSEEGHAGWAQTFFQVSSTIVCYFIYKKQWWKVVLSIALVVGMVAATNVRSILYFVLLPIVLYYIYKSFQLGQKSVFKQFGSLIPLALIMATAVVIVNYFRYDVFKLPEKELTQISLTIMENGGFPLQYFNSFFQYWTNLFPPIIKVINLFGLDLEFPAKYLPPSIPKLNDMYLTIYSTGANHMPAGIFHDFYMSFGYYGTLWAFVVFSYVKLLCDFLQKNTATFLGFSSVLGWHLYFLMRGACDSCSGGIAYSFFLGFGLYLILNKRVKILY